jgi:hypothetical protein
MYGDKPPLYSLSMYALFFGIGWLLTEYGKMGFGNVFPRILGLFLIIHFIDALIKGAIFAKDNFKLILKCRGV